MRGNKTTGSPCLQVSLTIMSNPTALKLTPCLLQAGVFSSSGADLIHEDGCELTAIIRNDAAILLPPEDGHCARNTNKSEEPFFVFRREKLGHAHRCYR
jgi:hypothetical protein